MAKKIDRGSTTQRDPKDPAAEPKQPTDGRTGAPRKTGKVAELMRPAPPDHKIFSMGWIVGQTYPGGSPKAKDAKQGGEDGVKQPGGEEK